MTKLFFEIKAYDINTRIANEGKVPLIPLVHVHELVEGGMVLRDDLTFAYPPPLRRCPDRVE